MKADLLVAEIGSTTTVVNLFNLGEHPLFLGQGSAPTTVNQGDVCVGLKNAIDNLENNLGCKVEYAQMQATSSAAGGLKMTVHGLVYDMTARAAKEAALGAGAIVKLITAGKLYEEDLRQIADISPNLILLAGGTDYGAREIPLFNAQLIAKTINNIPVLYAGNTALVADIRNTFAQYGKEVAITENVYPALDELNVEPTRRLIQTAFESNITKAKGMEKIRNMVSGHIIPTPGAVMESAMLCYELLGDVCVLDVGGATTDVHSVTEGSEAINSILTDAEPKAKRTVEGDLGVYVNAHHLLNQLDIDKLNAQLGFDTLQAMEEYLPIPHTQQQFALTSALTYEAAKRAVSRHTGVLKHIYTASGRQTVAQGKDLSAVKYLIGTGGALTRLPQKEGILRSIADLNANKTMLYPKQGQMKVLIDNNYIMASLGVMSLTHKEEAVKLLAQSLGITK